MILGKITLAKKISVVTVGLVLASSIIVIATFAVGNNKNLIHQHASELEARTQFLSPLVLKNISSAIKKSNKVNDILIEHIQFENTVHKIEEMLKSIVKAGQYLLEVNFENFKSKTKISIYKTPSGQVKVEHQNEIIANNEFDTEAHFSNVHLYKRSEWNSSETPVLELITPVKLADNTIIGRLKITIDFSENIELIKQLSNQRSRIFLVNPSGEYIYNSIADKVFSLSKGKNIKVQNDFDELNLALQNSADSKIIPRVHNQTGMALHFKRLDFQPNMDPKKQQWIGLVQVADYWESLVESETLRRKTYFFAGILIFITLIVATIFSKLISRDLQRITDAALQYTRGETELQLNIKSADEIGILANAFQGMIYQVNERTRRIKRSEEKAQKSKEMMEEALKANQELLENVQKQKTEIEKIDKEKDDLMAVVSHDLKNPLSVIESSMNIILESNSNLTPEILDLLARSKRGAKFGLNLITDLLEIARLEGGIILVPEVFNIKKLFNDCIQQFALPSKDKMIILSTEAEEDFEIFADYRKLSQVINNLLSNAIKFTPQNGTIQLLAKRESEFLRGSFGERQILKIYVKDSGIGVPTDKLTKIFNKYEQARTKDRETGTGLGLAICKNICELHNGKINVTSEEGKGTTFILDLPVLTSSNSVRSFDIHPEVILVSDNEVEALKIKEKFESSNIFTKIYSAERFLKISRLSLENPVILAEVSRPEILSLMFNLRQQKEWADVPIFTLATKFGRELLDRFAGLVDGLIEWPSNDAKYIFALKDFFPELKWIKPESTESVLAESPVAKVINIQQYTTPNDSLPKFKMLIIDDSEDTHQLIKIMLKSQPVQLIHAYNGKEGVSQFAEHLPDLVLMDINMPEIDGYKATKIIRQWELKKALGRTKILAITASDDSKTLENCKLAGMDGPFNKPFSKNDLIALVTPSSNKKAA